MRKLDRIRLGLLGCAALIAAGGAVSTAYADEYKFGELNFTFDTTVSAGAAVRTGERDCHLLAVSNGGCNTDARFNGAYNYNATDWGTINVTTNTGAAAKLSTNAIPSNVNHDGSVNADDGRLNYDSGDLYGLTLRASHDLQVEWRNYTAFFRGYEFYDFIQNDPSAGARSDYSDKVRGLVGRNAKLLDAFVSANYSIDGNNLNIRAGKQVINWGEGTFILNGVNTINTIDVSAFRRPGAEIKDGLLPTNSLYASLDLPIPGASIAAFYMLDFQPYEIDGAGTPFSGTDVFRQVNDDLAGNYLGTAFLSGGRFAGSFRRNCTNLASPAGGSGARGLYFAATGFTSTAAYDAAVLGQCPGGVDSSAYSGFVDYRNATTVGDNELIRQNLGDEAIAHRLTGDIVPGNVDNEFGFRANYTAEELGGTEFSAYYEHYNSRLPFVSYKSGRPTVGVATTGVSDSSGSRGLGTIGCAYKPSTATGVISGFSLASDGFLANLGFNGATYSSAVSAADFFDGGNGTPGGVGPSALTKYNLQQAAVGLVNDPSHLVNNGSGGFGPMATAAVAMASNFGAAGGALIAHWTAQLAADNALKAGYVDPVTLQEMNCMLIAAQSVAAGPLKGLLVDGAETLGAEYDVGFNFEYPTGIDLFGASFSTVIAGWGVQGEMTYRPNAPFQLDTDQLTIATIFDQCGSWVAGASSQFLQFVQNFKGANCPYLNFGASTPGNDVIHGYLRNEMYTAQIGTTATFTQSDWETAWSGADLGILVTEIGMVHVPGVKNSWADNQVAAAGSPTAQGPQYQNIGCQATDNNILGGLVGLAAGGNSEMCRPTDTSAGLVLLGRLDYNNAFNSGFVVSPLVAFSWDFYGTTPAPYGNYMQDRKSVHLGVDGTLNNNFKVGVGYTAYFGGHIENKAVDQDYATMDVSYSF